LRATYYISFGTTWTQIYPSNEPVLKLAQEGNEIFKRWKVDRFRITRTKNSLVYCTLMNMFFDPLSFGTEISYRIDIKGVAKYYFKDLIRAGTLNALNEVYECTPDPDDKYEPILRQYTKKWDNETLLFGLAEAFYYPSLSTGLFAGVDFNAFADSSGTITYQNDGVPAGPNYARQAISIPVPSSMVTILVTGLSYTGDAPKMKLVNSSYVTCSNEVTINANGKYELIVTGVLSNVYAQLSQNNLTGSPVSGSFSYQLFLPSYSLSGAKLYDILDRILNYSLYFNISPVCTVVSTLLFGSALGSDPPASIATYMTANPTNDYVIEGSAVFNNLYLTRTDSFTTAKEDNIELCLRDIMDILKDKRLFWFIDEDGKFRIEHEKYFRSYDPQADLTASTFAIYQPEADHYIYSYEGENYNQINFAENNGTHEDWTPIRIEYDPLLTGSEVKDIRTSVTTDIKTLIDDPSVSGSGITLLRCDANNNVYIDASLVTPANYYPNQKLSPAWISRYYSDYFAESQSGTLVTGVHSFVHVKEMVKQSGVKFFWNTDLDWKKPFTLSIGEGWLSAVEYFPETGFYSIDVLYSPYDFNIATVAGSTSTTADSTTVTVDDTLITVDG
jgi:hypothetical protein